MANYIEKLFNDAIVFKRTHLGYSDLELFFEFDTIKNWMNILSKVGVLLQKQ